MTMMLGPGRVESEAAEPNGASPTDSEHSKRTPQSRPAGSATPDEIAPEQI
jgi:hypothetical protein